MNFRELNKFVEVDPFLLPRINETLQVLERFKSATALDLSLGFHLIPLDKESQKIYSTIFPWGKYCSYLRIPIGVACAQSMFQSIMNETPRGLDVLVCIDDILVLQRVDKSTSDHLVKVEQGLQQLELAGLKANLRKRLAVQKSVKN